ncbi:MAG: PH domain-containing protein [Clostridium sp.]|nr:PH domain-containing protein [Clostridium sp.]
MEKHEFRCHYSVVFENLGRVFWLVVICCVGEFNEMADTVMDVVNGEVHAVDVLIAFGVLFAIICISFLVENIIWAKTWISIEEDAVVIEKRTLNRKKNTIGMKNISNINLEQNIFERMMNTYKIKLDTNSKTTADSTDVKIVLAKDKAEWFQRQVMEHMQNVTGEQVSLVEEEMADYDVNYSARDIVWHCIYTVNVFSVLILLGIVIGAVAGIRLLRTGQILLDGIVHAIGGLLVVAAVLFSVVQSLVRDFFVYYGFRAKRKGNKIYLTYGLLKKRKYVLAVDKINAVEVISPLVSRILKRQYVKLVCVGVGDEENENSMLLLSGTKEEMHKNLSVLLPEFTLEEGGVIRRNRLSIFSELPGKVLYFAVLIALMAALGYKNVLQLPTAGIYLIYAAGIFLMLLSVLRTVMFFRTEGLKIGENELIVIKGSYEKNMTWIPYQKIQQMEYREGPIARHFGLAAGKVHILATALDAVHAITYVKKEFYEQIAEQILNRGNADRISG